MTTILYIRSMKKILFLVAITLGSSTCGKKVIKVNVDYVGEWKEVPRPECRQKITIDENNRGEYTYLGNEECRDDIKGIARLTKNALMIGVRKFKIIESAIQIPDTVFVLDTMNMMMKVKIAKGLSNSGSIVTFYKKKK